MMSTILLLLLLFLSPPLWAATVYVDGTLAADCTAGNYSIANRACNGTDGNAWNTAQESFAGRVAGDIINVRAGTYAQNLQPTAGISGTQGNPIIFRPYLSEAVTLQNVGTTIGLKLHNVSYWQIGSLTNGFTIDGRSASNRCVEVNAINSTNQVLYNGALVDQAGVELLGNTVKNCGNTTITFPAGIVLETSATGCTGGTRCVGKGHRVEGNTFANWIGRAVTVFAAGDVTVTKNVMDNATAVGKYTCSTCDAATFAMGCVSIAGDPSTNGVISFNKCVNLKDAGDPSDPPSQTDFNGSPSGFWCDSGASGLVFEGNYVENLTGGSSFSNNGLGGIDESRCGRYAGDKLGSTSGAGPNIWRGNIFLNTGTCWSTSSTSISPSVEPTFENNVCHTTAAWEATALNGGSQARVHIRSAIGPKVKGNFFGTPASGGNASLVLGLFNTTTKKGVCRTTAACGAGWPLSVFEKNIWLTGTGNIVKLDFDHTTNVAVAVGNRPVSNLPTVPTSETNPEGVGETGATTRQENAATAMIDPDNGKFTQKTGSVGINGGAATGLFNGSARDIGAMEAPVHASAEIGLVNASTVVINLENNPFAPLLPATGCTGFTVKYNGVAKTINSCTRNGSNQIRLAMAVAALSTDTVTYSYSAGNVTDSALIGKTFSSELRAITDQAVTNNVAGAPTATLRQTRYRFRRVPGGEVAAPGDWLAAEDTAAKVIPGGKLRIRIKMDCTGGDCPATAPAMFWRVGADPFAQVTATCTAANKVCSYDAGDVANGLATTEQLTSGHVTDVAGKIIEAATAIPSVDLSQDSEVEMEYPISFDAGLAVGTVIDIRLQEDGGTVLGAYNVTPAVTIKSAEAAVTR